MIFTCIQSTIYSQDDYYGFLFPFSNFCLDMEILCFKSCGGEERGNGGILFHVLRQLQTSNAINYGFDGH